MYIHIHWQNFANMIHGQHCHIGYYICACQCIGWVLLISYLKTSTDCKNRANEIMPTTSRDTFFLLRWLMHCLIQGADSSNHVQNQTTRYPFTVRRQRKTGHDSATIGSHWRTSGFLFSFVQANGWSGLCFFS